MLLVLAPLLSGVLYVTAFFPSFSSFWITIALVPWLLSLQSAKSSTSGFFYSLIFGYTISNGGFFWITNTLQEFGDMPFALSLLGQQLFCLFNQLHFAIYGVLFCKFFRPYPGIEKSFFSVNYYILMLSFSYVVLEGVFPKLFKDCLGHAFYHEPGFLQLADVAGVSLMSFLVFAVNAYFWFFMRTLEKKYLGTALSILILWGLIGGYKYQYYSRYFEAIAKKSDTPHLDFALIQPNINKDMKILSLSGAASASELIATTHLRLTQQALQQAPFTKVVVWPELAYFGDFNDPYGFYQKLFKQDILNLVEKEKIYLLFGSFYTDPQTDQNFNAFIHLTPEGQWDYYLKAKLLLFGEYFPGVTFLASIHRYMQFFKGFAHGPGPKKLLLKGFSYQPNICYEALYPDFVLSSAKDDIKMLINVTNDFWFGISGASLHLGLTQFRSVENRIFTLRTTSTGYTTIITPLGDMMQKTQFNQEQVLLQKIPIFPYQQTLIKSFGNWFFVFSVLMTGFLCCFKRKIIKRNPLLYGK